MSERPDRLLVQAEVDGPGIERIVAALEAGAAVGVAALLAGKLSDLGEGPVIAVISGGNITPQAAASILAPA